jgi:hypothetical protein
LLATTLVLATPITLIILILVTTVAVTLTTLIAPVSALLLVAHVFLVASAATLIALVALLATLVSVFVCHKNIFMSRILIAHKKRCHLTSPEIVEAHQIKSKKKPSIVAADRKVRTVGNFIKQKQGYLLAFKILRQQLPNHKIVTVK